MSSSEGGTVCSVTVGICTFRRPAMLERLLERLADLSADGDGARKLEILVVDNDVGESGRSVVERINERADVPLVRYVVEPEQNISIARNRVAAEASGVWLAMLDDDEFPAPGWLDHLLAMAVKTGSDGVLGPVLPHYTVPPPSWIEKGRFFEKPRLPIRAGSDLNWKQTRTSNALLSMDLFRSRGLRFDPAFGRSGGEDVDFFSHAIATGARFVWCPDGAVYEEIGPERCRVGYLMRLGLLRGSFSRRYVGGSGFALAAGSALACGAYAALMPLFFLLGRHVALDYVQRWCEHAGRLLSTVGLDPSRERPEFRGTGDRRK
ncbi:MAG: glycosyltransferase family 2 protein [Gemmataceae bacterium]